MDYQYLGMVVHQVLLAERRFLLLKDKNIILGHLLLGDTILSAKEYNMLKYAKVINEETKLCEVGLGTNSAFYKSIGMTEMDVEQAYNGQWYVKGYAPVQPEPTEYEKAQERIAELKQMLADADYWTSKRIDGEYTDEEWAEKVAIRKAWRAEINELELVVDQTEIKDIAA